MKILFIVGYCLLYVSTTHVQCFPEKEPVCIVEHNAHEAVLPRPFYGVQPPHTSPYFEMGAMVTHKPYHSSVFLQEERWKTLAVKSI